MHQSKELHDSLVAPSPTVPTCRPSSLSPRNRLGTMSTQSLMTDTQPPPSSGSLRKSENESVAELASLSSQGTGAREVLKAGQRRLRLFGQRQKKPLNPKIKAETKAEEASRHLLALQQEGFLPVKAPRAPKWSSPKMSLDDTISSARSTSNFSFRSISRRDVEDIGQPWLTDPLEKTETRESRSELSPLKLGELASFVQAAVSFPLHLADDDTIPPPYQSQPPAHATLLSDDQSSTCAAGPQPRSSSGDDEQPPGKDATAVTSREISNGDNQQIPASLVSGGGAPIEETSSHNDQVRDEKELKSESSTDKSVVAAGRTSMSGISVASQNPPNPVAQSLKLFPDTAPPPRVSSKAAWRISAPRTPVPNTPLSVVRVLEQSRSSVAMEPTSGNSQSNVPPINHANPPEPTEPSSLKPEKPKSEPRISPVQVNVPPAKNSHRSSYLPMGTIDAFPLPVQMRPLPSLPEPVSSINASGDRNTQAKLMPPTNPNHLRSNSSSRDRSRTNSATSVDYPQTTHDETPNSMLDNRDSTASRNNSVGTVEPNQPEQPSSVGASNNRVEKVRALKLRDMSSCLSLQGSDMPADEEKGQSSEPPISPTSDETRISHVRWVEKPADGSRHHRNYAPSDAPSSPPLSSLPPKPPIQSASGWASSKRHCSSPSMAQMGNREPSTLPISNRSSLICRSNSSRSTEMLREMVSSEQPAQNRPGSPVPSSDDGVGIAVPKYGPHQASDGRRRTKPGRHIYDDPRLHKMRHSKKPPTPPEYDESFTSWNKSSRGLEKPLPSLKGSQSIQSNRNRASYIIESLEERIAQLERQNRILQAALLAALDVNVKQNPESLLGSRTSFSRYETSSSAGRSASSSTNHSSRLNKRATENGRHLYGGKPHHRPQSWIDSPDSSQRSSYQTDDSASFREIEEMIEDFEFTWPSDRSGSERMYRQHGARS